MHAKILLFGAASAALTLPVQAQGAVFQTPGMPRSAAPANPASGSNAGQSTRFDNSFNPALSFVFDGVADQVNADGGDDGVDLSLRVLELAAQAWVDPNAWAYFIAAADEESLNVEEAAVHYTGLGGNSTLRAGRFFIDFGKQMQTHVHELRTLERPLVLRTFLGDEVKGDGVQWDCWTTTGDAGALRWSIGAFRSLLPEAEDDGTSAFAEVAERKSAGDLNATARVTAFHDVGDNGTFQLGASARVIPDYAFAFSPSGDAAVGLDNTVYGVDVTYGWHDDTGLERWTVGGEFLVSTGDVGADVTDVGSDGDPTNDTVAAVDDTRTGWFAFVDCAWNPSHSVGLQYSSTELTDAAGSDASEVEAYYTWQLSEFHRLRFAASALESDLDPDAQRFAVQYTAIVGAHGHGVNW
ncbi:MAG: hypothetical protein IPJ77_15505 [Planctomycetes bacterium]|nr:hypothetical protein [Planctomycetota bacterium]